MKKVLFAALACALLLCSCSAQYEWKKISVCGSQTGVVASSADNVPQTMGHFVGDTYVSPNGRRFDPNSVAAQNARILLDVQPAMKDVKQVVAYSPVAMTRKPLTGALPYWFVDNFMEFTAKEFGQKIDVGLVNYGGIRQDMPQGDVLKDDIVSMFPFKNHLVYAKITGENLVKLFEEMAANRFQMIGGAKVVLKGNELVSMTVGGEPVDPNKVYGLATVDFLLDGGDGVRVRHWASELLISDVLIVDAVYPYVLSLTAAGKNIEYSIDDRITIVR